MIPYSLGLKAFEHIPPRMRVVAEGLMRPIPRRTLFGKGFQEKLALLQTMEGCSRKELEDFQLKRLRYLLDHAYRNVPYYHDLMKEEGVHPANINSIAYLRKVPVLTKDVVRREFDRLKAADATERSPGDAHTTGSTGRPLHFLLDQENREVELASVWRHYRWGGVRDMDARIASFRGDLVSDRGSRLWRWDGKLGELAFNTYLLDRDNLALMVERLNRFRPEIVRAYPHALYIVSKGIEAWGKGLDFTPRLVHTSSEQLPRYMRESIEAAFGTKVFDWYSQSEYVVSAGECPHGRYHQVMETGVLEVQEDAWGSERAVGTGLWNLSMPFINYEVGDHVRLGDEECPCGRRHLILDAIEGRLNDVLVTPDGRGLSGVGIDNYYEKEIISRLRGVPDHLKVVQEGLGIFTIEMYRKEGMVDEDLDHIQKGFSALLGEGATVTVRLLDGYPEQRKWKNVETRLSPLETSRALEPQ